MNKMIGMATLAALLAAPALASAQDQEPISFSDEDLKQAPGYDAEEDARLSEEHKAAREAELRKAGDDAGAGAHGLPGKTTTAPDGRQAVAVSWREGDERTRARLAGLDGAEAPPLNASEWLNASALDWESLKGKIVVLDFWATWCGPCLQSVPGMNQMAEKYADKGVVVIGVCNSRGVEKMKDTAIRFDIKYPICADVNDSTVRAYRVDGFPDYYIVDHEGRVAMADVRADALEVAVQAMIARRARAAQAPGK